MSNETTLTIAGNLVDDPELRFTPGKRAAGGEVPHREHPAVLRQAGGGSGRTATRCS